MRYFSRIELDLCLQEAGRDGNQIIDAAEQLGFAIVQVIVALLAMWAAYWLWCGDKLYANARVVGGIVAGVGLTIMVQTGLAQMFPV